MINVEIKACCDDLGRIRQLLEEQDARHVGEDHQVDTYFHTRDGRLKLREGEIENALIFYRRSDQSGPKVSEVLLYESEPSSPLKPILMEALGKRVVVDKRRDIFFIDNVKFHLDRVRGLGTFVEIEAIDRDETLGREHLLRQCEQYLTQFEVAEDDLISVSYSDLLKTEDEERQLSERS